MSNRWTASFARQIGVRDKVAIPSLQGVDLALWSSDERTSAQTDCPCARRVLIRVGPQLGAANCQGVSDRDPASESCFGLTVSQQRRLGSVSGTIGKSRIRRGPESADRASIYRREDGAPAGTCRRAGDAQAGRIDGNHEPTGYCIAASNEHDSHRHDVPRIRSPRSCCEPCSPGRQHHRDGWGRARARTKATADPPGTCAQNGPHCRTL